MAKEHLISSANLLAKVWRDFKPTASGWDIDAIEWIGDALNIMKLSVGTVQDHCEIDVKNYRAKLPCAVEALYFITDQEGCLIDPINSHVIISKAAQLYEKVIGKAITRSRAHYQVNGNIVHFSFAEGKIIMYYECLPTDENGFPKIPKDSMITQALSWYIIRQLCLRGMQHPVVNFQMADARWEEYYPRAQNRSKKMTPEDRALFHKNWVSLIPTLHRRESYYTDIYVRLNNQNSDINDFLGTTIQK